MSREDFVAIAVRLFAIYLLLGVIKHVFGVFSQNQGVTGVIPFALVLIVGLFICALLWYFPLIVARKLLPVMREPCSEQALDSSLAMSVGLTLIGVWIMGDGLMRAGYWLSLFVLIHGDTMYFKWSHQQIASMIATVVQIAIAAWLIFGSSGIKRLIDRYRYGYGASQDEL
jgi:hypothetical protein